MQHRSLAIILKRIAYSDCDWIVTFFSRDMGRMSGIAKSARASKRRFGGALEPGALVEVLYAERRSDELVRIDEVQMKRSMAGTLKSLARINAMALSLELALGFLQERQPSPDKFDLLEDFLLRLNERDPSPWEMLQYEFKWLSHCGFRPRLFGCAACGKGIDAEDGWAFDVEEGGLVCTSCGVGSRGKISLAKGAIEGLAGLGGGASGVGDEGARAASYVLHRYIGHIIGRPLKSPSLCVS